MAEAPWGHGVGGIGPNFNQPDGCDADGLNCTTTITARKSDGRSTGTANQFGPILLTAQIQRPSFCSNPLYKLGQLTDNYGQATQFAGQSLVVAGLIGAGIGAIASGGPGAAPGFGLAGLGAEFYAVGGLLSLGGNILKSAGGDGRSFASVVGDTVQRSIENMGGLGKLGQVAVGSTVSAATSSVEGADPCQ